MDIPTEGRLWTQLEARVILNCLFNIKFIAHPAKLTSSKGSSFKLSLVGIINKTKGM